MTENKDSILHQKLSEFIIKYHQNELYKGLSIFVILFFSFSLLFGISELFFYLSPIVKISVFTVLLATIILVLALLVLRPLLRIYGLFGPLSTRNANDIIQQHFPEIQDHLINALELINQSPQSADNSMLLASIAQKTSELAPIRFTLAIDVTNAAKYAGYSISALILFCSVYFFWPEFNHSTERLINITKLYRKPAPFQFNVSGDLTVSRGSPYLLQVHLTGDALPQSLQLLTPFGNFMLHRVKADVFEYEFQSVFNSFDFSFKSGKYFSDSYNLQVLPSPLIKDFIIKVVPPSYTGSKPFQSSNNTSLSVPEGSQLVWEIHAANTDSVLLIRKADVYKFSQRKDQFEYKAIGRTGFVYSLSLYNEFFTDSTFSNYSLDVEKDLFPKIHVSERKDSTGKLISYFKGIISDDYGLTDLKFNLRFFESDSTVIISIPFDKNKINQQFFYSFDFSKYSHSKNFEYFFSVSDNDGVNGSKTSTSDHLFYSLPTQEALAQLEDKVNEKLLDKIDKAIEQSNKIQNEIKEIKAKLINENVSKWQRDQMLNSISEKQNDLQKLVNDINKENQSKNDLVQNLSEKEELKEKQKLLQELLGKVMDDELQNLMDELKKLTENFDRNKFFDLSEKLDMSYNDLSEQLDKNIELLKRYDIERKIDNLASAIEKLSDNQNKLGEDLLDKNENNPDAIKEMQDKLSELQDDYNKLAESNDELDKPFDLDDFKSDFEDIQSEMSNASQQQQDGKKKQSSASMKSASQKSKDLAQKMQSMMEQNTQQQAMENIDNLRQILDNLILFSFSQEKLISSSTTLTFQDPRVPQFANEQQLLRENFTVIQDSLYALARREPQIGAHVNKEILEIQNNIGSSIRYLEDSKSANARVNQQFAMTGTNNIALLLSEVLKRMQESAAQNMEGNQQCQNPSSKGKGSPSLSDMKGQQQSMKQQLQQMIDQMKSEQNKPGNKPGQNQGMSKQLSKMLGEQEKYNQQLNQLMKEGSLSPEAVKQLNEIKKLMDKNELDIVNRNITPSSLYRQDMIISRLLEAEKAERERDMDDKRKANTGSQSLKSNPETYFTDEMKQFQFKDVIEPSSLELNRVYKQIYEEYLIKLSSDN